MPILALVASSTTVRYSRAYVKSIAEIFAATMSCTTIVVPRIIANVLDMVLTFINNTSYLGVVCFLVIIGEHIFYLKNGKHHRRLHSGGI